MGLTVPLLSFDGRGGIDLDLVLEVAARAGADLAFELIEEPELGRAVEAVGGARAAFSLAELDAAPLLRALGARLLRTCEPVAASGPREASDPGGSGGRPPAGTPASLPRVYSLATAGLALERGGAAARGLIDSGSTWWTDAVEGPPEGERERCLPADAGLAVDVVSTAEAAAVVAAAFEHARRSALECVTVVHGKSAAPATDGLFLHAARNVAVRYDDLSYRDEDFETFARGALRDRARYDVLVGTPGAAGAALDLLSAVAGVDRPPTVIECASERTQEAGVLLFGRHGQAGGQPALLRALVALFEHLGDRPAAGRLARALEQGRLHAAFPRRPGPVVLELLGG